MMINKRYTKEEKLLLLSALKYSEVTGMSKTKLAWGLANIMGRTDNGVYSQICALSKEQVEIPEEFWQLVDKQEQDIELIDNEMDIVDDYLEQKIGDIVNVRAVSLRTFGAVCAVENSTRTLLLHVSEIADEYIDDVSMYVEEGDEFLAMIIVNKQTNRLALSTKRVGTIQRKEPKGLRSL